MVKRKRKAPIQTVQPNSDAANNGVKRTRISKACDQCGTSREKCTGSTPCQQCASQNRACTYEEPLKKRDVQPNYIRALELALASTFTTIPEVEAALLTSLDADIGNIINGSDIEGAGELQRTFKASSVYRKIDHLLAGMPSPHNHQHTENQFNNASDGSSTSTLLKDHTPNALHDVVAHNGRYSETFVPTASNLVATLGFSGQIRLPGDAWKLLEHYLAFTHSWLPMTESYRMQKLMYEYPSEGLTKDQVKGAEHAELWSIMALAAAQLYDENIRNCAQHIRDVAEHLIPTTGSNNSYQASHIKAMLNLTLLDMSEEHILAAWLRIGPVVSLLMLFPLLEKLGATVKKCKHVHLAAFILEQALASHLHVPTHSKASFIERIGLVEEEGVEEWSPWHDPTNVTSNNDNHRPPMRAHSTMNELVRIALRSSDQETVTHDDGCADITAVSSLLKNATFNEKDRVQPHILLAKHVRRSGLG